MRLVLRLLPLAFLASCAHVSSQVNAPYACRVGSIRYDTLRIGQDPVYVRPDLVTEGDSGRILIAGESNFRFTPNGEYFQSVDSPFGLVLESGGETTLISHPLPGRRTDGLRAARIPGGWAVVFAEMRSAEGRRDSAVALWYGELRGGRWASLERIESGSYTYNPDAASALATTERGLAWVVPAEQNGNRLLLFRRDGTSWTVEQISSSAPRVEPVVSRGVISELIELQADPTLNYDDSSLLLFRKDSIWKLTAVLSAGLVEPATNLQFQPTPEGGVLTWRARGPEHGPLRARVRDELGWHRRLTVAENHLVAEPLRPVRLPEGSIVWGSTTLKGEAAWIQFHELENDTIETFLEIPSPFIHGFGLAARADSLVLLGAVAPNRRYIATLKLTVPVQCGPVPA